MNTISVLSQDTIDKIAAGEVVERPASIVKELVENSIDAGANAVTVEIRDGGTSLIRITDNGSGIPMEQVPVAFLRHATSKIRTVDDLITSGTLGFRGEALSSIAAIAQVELITKTAGSLTGTRYVIEGGVEKSLEEIGAPEGTTFLVRNMFYNTPARKKFLKSAVTEAGYISELMERLALSHPGISFKFMNQGQTKLHTSGNCRLKDIIYGVYGREISANVLPVESDCGYFKISGLIGKPMISRGNRNYENYFVNGRYVRSNVISKAIEEAYKPFMMNHRYPFTVLSIEMNGEYLDANVHPTKMEVRFSDQMGVYDRVYKAVKDTLAGKELIPEISLEKQTAKKPDENTETKEKPKSYPEPFETVRKNMIRETQPQYKIPPKSGGVLKPVTGNIASEGKIGISENRSVTDKMSVKEPAFDTGNAYTEKTVSHRIDPVKEQSTDLPAKQNTEKAAPDEHAFRQSVSAPVPKAVSTEELILLQRKTDNPDRKIPGTNTSADQKESKNPEVRRKETQEPEVSQKAVQMELFEDKLLSKENVKEHKLVGQVFDTYWIVEFRDKMYIIDQHAAHEKVLYERFIRQLKEKQQTSQQLSPPWILSLSMQEESLLNRFLDNFTAVGFEIEPFGGREYSIRAVPGNLYDLADKDIFLEMLDSLADVSDHAASEMINDRIATMSCKAAVKGNNRMTAKEADALIGELLTLENPYNCPHGRPTIISMTKYELEKKFKRIL